MKSHFHHDIRFMFIADRSENFIVSDESFGLKWVKLEEIDQFTGQNGSINRMARKTKAFLN